MDLIIDTQVLSSRFKGIDLRILKKYANCKIKIRGKF